MGRNLNPHPVSAHNGVVTTITHASRESFEEFCARQYSRVEHLAAAQMRRYRQRLRGVREDYGLEVESRGVKQPMGIGSYATREATDKQEETTWE